VSVGEQVAGTQPDKAAGVVQDLDDTGAAAVPAAAPADTAAAGQASGSDDTAAPDEAGEAFRGKATRWLAELWPVIAPAAVFLGIRAIGLVWLSHVSDVYDKSLTHQLSRWDGRWMLGIAGGGYSEVPPGLSDAFGHRTAETPYAFFPGYPGAVGLIRYITGTPALASGIAVSLAAGVFLAYGLATLGELVPGGSRRAGLYLVALVSAAPMGLVWSMTYSEGLFSAFSVWALVAVLRRHWVIAGACAAMAGTIRPTAGALLLAVGAAMLLAAYRRQDSWRPWAGGVIAPLGLLGYLGFVAWKLGSPSGWFGLQQRGWRSQFDVGRATTRFSFDVLTSGRSVLEVGTVLVLVGAVVLLVVCIRTRVPWPLWVYAAGVLVMDVGSNGLMNSKARLALPAVTLLIPVALALAKRRPITVAGVLVAATLASAWFGAYSLTGWNYAI
jgi:hypothetical protein